jgi:hypothetical protein
MVRMCSLDAGTPSSSMRLRRAGEWRTGGAWPCSRPRRWLGPTAARRPAVRTRSVLELGDRAADWPRAAWRRRLDVSRVSSIGWLSPAAARRAGTLAGGLDDGALALQHLGVGVAAGCGEVGQLGLRPWPPDARRCRAAARLQPDGRKRVALARLAGLLALQACQPVRLWPSCRPGSIRCSPPGRRACTARSRCTAARSPCASVWTHRRCSPPGRP